jgi:hypothetical protein
MRELRVSFLSYKKTARLTSLTLSNNSARPLRLLTDLLNLLLSMFGLVEPKELT